MERLNQAAALAAIKSDPCGGKCQHGGACRNGECVCPDGWEGHFCEEKEEGIAAELIFFFIITVILVVAIVFWKFGKSIHARIRLNIGGPRPPSNPPPNANPRGQNREYLGDITDPSLRFKPKEDLGRKPLHDSSSNNLPGLPPSQGYDGKEDDDDDDNNYPGLPMH